MRLKIKYQSLLIFLNQFIQDSTKVYSLLEAFPESKILLRLFVYPYDYETVFVNDQNGNSCHVPPACSAYSYTYPIIIFTRSCLHFTSPRSAAVQMLSISVGSNSNLTHFSFEARFL